MYINLEMLPKHASHAKLRLYMRQLQLFPLYKPRLRSVAVITKHCMRCKSWNLGIYTHYCLQTAKVALLLYIIPAPCNYAMRLYDILDVHLKNHTPLKLYIIQIQGALLYHQLALWLLTTCNLTRNKLNSRRVATFCDESQAIHILEAHVHFVVLRQPTKCSQKIYQQPRLSTMITSGLQNLVLSKLNYLILTH